MEKRERERERRGSASASAPVPAHTSPSSHLEEAVFGGFCLFLEAPPDFHLSAKIKVPAAFARTRTCATYGVLLAPRMFTAFCGPPFRRLQRLLSLETTQTRLLMEPLGVYESSRDHVKRSNPISCTLLDEDMAAGTA